MMLHGKIIGIPPHTYQAAAGPAPSPSYLRSPWTWLLATAAVAAVGWYLVRRRRYAPNRADSKRAKSYLARSAARDKVARVREDHEGRTQALRARKRRVQKKVTKGCDASRKRTSQEVKKLRKRERARINKKVDAIRGKTEAACRARRQRVRELAADAQHLADEERDERMRIAKQLGAAERKRAKQLAASERRRERREKQSESDDEVEQNLDRELVPVWRKVKRDMKATPKMSRTEAFLHWVEENEGEMWAMRQDEIEREMDDLAAEQAAYYEQRSA